MSIESQANLNFSKQSEAVSMRGKGPSNLKSLSLSQLKTNEIKSYLKTDSNPLHSSYDEDSKYRSIRKEIDSIQAKISNIEFNTSKVILIS